MEKKLTDEEIVKALERCGDIDNCYDCPIMGEMERRNCMCQEVVLDLIHRLQEENKRLTKEHERIAWSKQEYLDWVHGFLSTHTDMKDRGEKFEEFDRDWMCNVFWEKIVGALEYIIDLENQRNELQKKVDELNAGLNRVMNEHDKMASYAQLLEEKNEQAVEQTVNDMGKEIYKRVTDNLKMWLRERYDVEVE